MRLRHVELRLPAVRALLHLLEHLVRVRVRRPVLLLLARELRLDRRVLCIRLGAANVDLEDVD